MKIKTILLAGIASASLPVLGIAQTAAETTSPTSSADGGAQTIKTEADPYKHGPTSGRVTDVPKLSPTNTQTGGVVDTGTPKDDADKNSQVEHSGTTDTSTSTRTTTE